MDQACITSQPHAVIAITANGIHRRGRHTLNTWHRTIQGCERPIESAVGRKPHSTGLVLKEAEDFEVFGKLPLIQGDHGVSIPNTYAG